MEELQKSAAQHGIQPGAQMSRFLLWVGNECFEKREVPDLMVLAARAKELAKMFLAQDRKRYDLSAAHPNGPDDKNEKQVGAGPK